MNEADMGLITRKRVLGVCDQVRLNLTCSATETSYNIEILHVFSLVIILLLKLITKALSRLRGCAGWSASLLFVCN